MSENTNISHKKAKKKLLVIIAIIAGVLAVLACVSLVIDLIENRKQDNGTEIKYNFYPADYEENIFIDEKYLELIEGEFMRYKDSTMGLTLGINRESAKEQGAEVEFLVEMLYSVIYGNAGEYNACFSSSYYETHDKKDDFTMQKIYDVTITFISSEKVSEDSGNYTKSVYGLEYKIYHNNGTFRRDIGDGSKLQYITLTDASGALLIDSVTTVNSH